jgi:hypothetical protein
MTSALAVDDALAWYLSDGLERRPSAFGIAEATSLREALAGERPWAADDFEAAMRFAQVSRRLAELRDDVPPCSLGDAVTAAGARATFAAPAWPWQPSADADVLDKLQVKETSAGIVVNQRENREGWWGHGQRSRSFVTDAIALCARRELAVVLGAGQAFDIPLLELARRFERVVLVDIDGAALAATAASAFADAALRAKVELRPMDLTGINQHLIGELDRLLAAAGDGAATLAALDGLCRSYRLAEGPRWLAAGERADLLVSSCVLSQIAWSQQRYARNGWEARFGPLRGAPAATWASAWRELETRVQQDHVNALVEAGDVAVLTSDVVKHTTTLDGLGIERDAGVQTFPLTVPSLRERIPAFMTAERHAAWSWGLRGADRRKGPGTRLDVEGLVLRAREPSGAGQAREGDLGQLGVR